MDDLSGQAIKGYELHDMIGAGGFGAVYRAYQPLIKRDVAMKIILPEYANHPEFIRRFEFEAQLIARLEHIHIVPLYDYWRQPDGAFLIMRLLRGGSLRGVLKEGPVDTATAVRVAEQIAAALGTAHRRGVVHRDIKPDNILFDEDGNAYLADFGIAKDLREVTLEGDSSAGLTDEGALTGSPFYLSPEQAQSLPVTPQTDLYSLGIVLYEMLVGEPPFHSDQGLVAILLQHINDPVPSIQDKRPDLPSAVDVVIQRATAKEPASRYGDVMSLATDFRRALVGVDATAPVPARDDVTPLDEVLVITKPLAASTLIIIPPAELINPYKGLQPFQEADASDFFGRDLLIEKLIERMQEPGDISRFLAVIGPSGSGKSSVVKAGLIPAIRKGALPNSEHWYITQMVPGADPFRELANALLGIAIDPPQGLLEKLRTDKQALVDAINVILPPGDDEGGLVLMIDQFEEVFTLLDDEAARAHFLDLLLAPVAVPNFPFRLIITLRADFYDRPLLYPGFGEMVRRRNEVVLPLSADEMREAIVGPAEHAGVIVETGLVAAIIAEIAEQPGALPLLQYALTEVFERKEGNVLTLNAYHESGGVLGALARRAEELYQQTDAEGQDAMRQVFIRLVNLGEGAEDTRRRAMQHELMGLVEDEKVVLRVIDALGKYRLLTFDHDPDTRAPTVAVAHEALIREWKRLRSWLDESREDILLQRRLAAANEEWQKLRRDPSFLATGVRLQQFESLVQRETIALTPQEIDYVKASVVQREQREAEERDRLAREAALEKRSRDRMRALAVVLAVAAVITSVLAILAFASFQNAEDQRKNAEKQRKFAVEQRTIAERNAQVSDSLALVASAQTQLSIKNRDLAIALALQANQIPDPPIESQLVLGQAALSPGTRRILSGHAGPVFAVAYSPDGKTAISGSYDQSLILWDLATGEIIRQFGPDNPDTADVIEGHAHYVRTVAINPDGKTFLSGSNDKTMIWWNIETGEIIHVFGPDNSDTADVIEGHAKAVRTVLFHPDGKTVISASEDMTLIRWDMETGAIIRQYGPDNADTEDAVEGHAERVRGAALSPDGTLLASAGYDKRIILWDLETGEILHIMLHDDKAACVTFSPDGTQLLSGSADRTLRLWDVETGAEVRRMQGHGSWVKSVGFTPDGLLALSAGDDVTARLWDVATGTEVDRFVGHGAFIEQAVLSPDASQFLSASGDGTLRVWDLTNGAEIRRLRGHTSGVLSVAISPDGQTALTGSYDSSVRIWNLATGEQIGHFDEYLGGGGFVSPLVFSPDGQYALSSDNTGGFEADNILLMWNVQTGEVVQRFVGHLDWVLSAAFTPDGSQIITGSKDNTAILWDVKTGEQIRQFVRSDLDPYEPTLQFWVNSVALSADGSQLFTGTEGAEGLIILWDVATGEEIRRFEGGHEGTVNSIALSPDGKTIVSASGDNTLIVWDVATGAKLYRLQGHTAAVQRALFSPDGTVIASASYDGTIRLWDAATGEQVRQLDNGPAVWALAYTPDGKTVLSGSEDTTVRLWDATPLTLDRLLEWTHANRYVFTDFTCLQREQYRLEPKCDAEGNVPTSTP